MKILIDTTEIKLNRLNSSIPIYILRYISNIKMEERFKYILLINEECRSFFEQQLPGYKLVSFKFRGWNRYWLFNPVYRYNQYKFNKLIQRLNVDTIFIPTDYPIYLQNKLCCKKVIVIHDLKGVKRICNTKYAALESLIVTKMYGRHLRTADKIIAISKYTKQDIQIYYPNINEEKIHVIYNSVSLAEKSIKPFNFKINNEYILYVNSLFKHKNLITLIKAFSKLPDDINYKLVIVGKSSMYWEEQIMPFIERKRINDKIIHLQNLTNEELRFLYENASLFITTSLNEGFGYTPIEAAICKTPVISSIQEALPDSTQGLLYYYQPAMDDEKLTKAIINVLKAPPSEKRLEEVARYYKQLYSIENQIKLIQALLES